MKRFLFALLVICVIVRPLQNTSSIIKSNLFSPKHFRGQLNHTTQRLPAIFKYQNVLQPIFFVRKCGDHFSSLIHSLVKPTQFGRKSVACHVMITFGFLERLARFHLVFSKGWKHTMRMIVQKLVSCRNVFGKFRWLKNGERCRQRNTVIFSIRSLRKIMLCLQMRY